MCAYVHHGTGTAILTKDGCAPKHLKDAVFVVPAGPDKIMPLLYGPLQPILDAATRETTAGVALP